VPDPADPATAANQRLLELQAADVLLLAGEARSHCVANAVRDLAAAFDPGNIGKLHLLADCTSDVQGFEQLGRDFGGADGPGHASGGQRRILADWAASAEPTRTCTYSSVEPWEVTSVRACVCIHFVLK
jgi:hypothetical protein